MKLSDAKANYRDEELDPRPGVYYISIIDGPQFGLLAGPYATHREALGDVDKARDAACKVDAKAWFYAFGTCRMDEPIGPGVLNKHGLV